MPYTTSAEAQAAVLKSWAFTKNRSARTQPAREKFWENLQKKVDPDGTMPPHERAQAAALLYKAHFLAMNAKSAKVRKANAEKRKAKAQAMKAAREQEIAQTA